jgi:hypothetical protein
MRNRCNILDSSNPEPATGKHSDSRLCAGAGSSCAVSAWRSDTNVKRVYATVSSHSGRGLCSLHCGIRRTLKSIGLNMLTAGADGNRFGTREVGYVNHRVVE